MQTFSPNSARTPSHMLLWYVAVGVDPSPTVAVLPSRNPLLRFGRSTAEVRPETIEVIRRAELVEGTVIIKCPIHLCLIVCVSGSRLAEREGDGPSSLRRVHPVTSDSRLPLYVPYRAALGRIGRILCSHFEFSLSYNVVKDEFCVRWLAPFSPTQS